MVLEMERREGTRDLLWRWSCWDAPGDGVRRMSRRDRSAGAAGSWLRSWWIMVDFTEGKRMEETDWGEKSDVLWHVKFDLPFSHPSKGTQRVKVRV